MAAERAAALKQGLGGVKWEHSVSFDTDKEGASNQGISQRRETIQIFAATEDGLPGEKGIWKRRTMEFE
jgi:hypothetical protein